MLVTMLQESLQEAEEQHAAAVRAFALERQDRVNDERQSARRHAAACSALVCARTVTRGDRPRADHHAPR